MHVARPRYDIHVINNSVSPEIENWIFFPTFPKTLKCSLTFNHVYIIDIFIHAILQRAVASFSSSEIPLIILIKKKIITCMPVKIIQHHHIKAILLIWQSDLLAKILLLSDFWTKILLISDFRGTPIETLL